MARYLVCMTGASGSIYGLRLLAALAASQAELHLVASEWGKKVLLEESGRPLEAWLADLGPGRVHFYEPSDLGSAPASGSFRLDATLIVPASMATVASLAAGTVSNLVHRAGSVALKEGWPLVVAPRETPLSLIDLRNLERLAEAGAIIMPAAPPFYNRPRSIEELADGFVGKILDRIGAPNPASQPWDGLSAKGAVNE
jgi:4-hydroxy-3-polyprenylbenzoate decarboxylase